MNANVEAPRFFDRELSWLEFNARVLHEAMDASNPILDRVLFSGIFSSNLDEFFMVRLPSLEAGSDIEKEVRAKARALTEEQSRHWAETLVPELEAIGIRRVVPESLDSEQAAFVRSLFDREIFPVLTPIALSGERTVPSLTNLSLYMIVSVSPIGKTDELEHAVIEVPRNLSRMIVLPGGGHSFILLEDVIRLYAARLFEGYEVRETGLIRLTRGAEMTLDEAGDEDFAKVMAQALRKRKRGEFVRLEADASEEWISFLEQKLAVQRDRIEHRKDWFDLKGVSSLAFLAGYSEHRRAPWTPKPHPAFADADDIFEVIREKDVLLHHPYDSFDPVIQLVQQAADDPDVLAVKQTLYRTASRSRLVRALERAAEKGKSVTVLVELKARFDEAENIQWAARLERAGASVVYGVARLKTHAKACLIVRREADGIRRYAHLGTGNYNESTAKLYTDHGLLTDDEKLTRDLSSLFNMITGFSKPLGTSKLVVAPLELRRTLLRLIQREAQRSTPEQPGRIAAKMNSLVDEDIIEALYEASRAGVRVRLNVRGTCRLVPGVPGRSDTIEVVSIVDRFLEHSRIFCFRNGGDDEVYLSSADWMPRNLDRRVETMFPIEDAKLAREILDTMKLYFRDNVRSWLLKPDGSYERRDAGDREPFRVQEELCRRYEEREARRRRAIPRDLKPRKPESNR